MIKGQAADVIIIGGGIIGAACADELASRGLEVLVLDCQRPAATAAGMGHLVVLDDNPAELALGEYSVRLWRELAKQTAWKSFAENVKNGQQLLDMAQAVK